MTILVVDDSPTVLRVMSYYLGKEGFQVFTASDVPQALDILEREQIKLLITDQSMPFVDGVTFINTLRLDPRWKDLTVIMLTGGATDEVQDKSMRAGAAFVLQKPVDFNKLLALVRFAL